MKFFLDTEFIEDGSTIDLISIGLICEDGRELYLQNADCKFTKAGDWVTRFVYPHLLHFDMGARDRTCKVRVGSMPDLPDVKKRCADPLCPWRARHAVRDDVKAFVEYEAPGSIEFWGYYSDYDWVVFCQLFGRMIDLPPGFPMFCLDLRQKLHDRGNPKLPKQDADEHHALADARWIRDMFMGLVVNG